ncbi:MAG TPA: hypothetical protein VGM50_14575 [Gemmatimonadaceae bacterium]|jgi:hypothetical protein
MAHVHTHPHPQVFELESPAGLIDMAAEWLLTHCPFTTLTVLTTLVIGSIITIPQPVTLAIVVPLADVLFNLIRVRRRSNREQMSSSPTA